jgi:hypothetical protein
VALQTVTKRYPHHIPIIKTLYLQILLFKSQFVMGKSANPFYDLFFLRTMLTQSSAPHVHTHRGWASHEWETWWEDNGHMLEITMRT